MIKSEPKKMEELSIDPDCRKFRSRELNLERSNVDSDSNSEKAHFKIDWRQLSYFKNNNSYTTRFLNRFSLNKAASSSSKIKTNTTTTTTINDEESIYSDLTSTSFNSFSSNQQQASNYSIKSSSSSSSSSPRSSSTSSSSCRNVYGINNDNFENKSSNQQEKQILNSLDGCFKSGELSAILGPSGAGKTTFLSTLFGSKQESAYGQTKVTWFVNSDEEAKRMIKRPLKTAFLPQNDHLLHHLTVYETLIFASKIKNPSLNKKITSDNNDSKTTNFHRQNVRRVAKMLKLIDCLDTRCGKLSGGQYKRVSIAQELLSEPDVMILDEPTSGLDAATCLTTILTLKSIVKKHPMSIILTIHQPDSDVFNLFDHIYVIAQGGLAIYEGPPSELVNTMRQVNLIMPNVAYNPARFIVENAFLIPETEAESSLLLSRKTVKNNEITTTTSTSLINQSPNTPSSSSEEEEDDDDEDDNVDGLKSKERRDSFLKRSVLSITEALSGKEMASGKKKRTNQRDKKPLLNIGFQTLDGRLITSEQLTSNDDVNKQTERQDLIENKFLQERLTVLKRLNQIQKFRYYNHNNNINNKTSDSEKSTLSNNQDQSIEDVCGVNRNGEDEEDEEDFSGRGKCEKSSAKSDYSSAAWSIRRQNITDDDYSNENGRSNSRGSKRIGDGKSVSLVQLSTLSNLKLTPSTTNKIDKKINENKLNCSLQMFDRFSKSSSNSQGVLSKEGAEEISNYHEDEENSNEVDQVVDGFVVDFSVMDTINGGNNRKQNLHNNYHDNHQMMMLTNRKKIKLKRQFDKRLSAKHNSSKHNNHPILYHSLVLTHRTWLSIIRDPIFFGIQACMHITIPILLSLIFGSVQEEGCPILGNFDLVKFAYSDSDNMIQGTVKSIKQSVGNIGIVFFEMFVLSFSINCITALVFPMDMYVLLKEYRNSWYSMRSYFIGRTLADLPVLVGLHSIGFSILYFLTGQPQSIGRFSGIVALVILASLVAQSVGLTIGALLMKSSQSAVLAAAGIVAPFFALSGFIVRINTLPIIAQIGAKLSYLYHLLNGFIILRYGFDRCQCKEEDFDINEQHQIPNNLHTLASIWIGTYSNEYGNNNDTNLINTNRTNVDPNIDIVDKMLTAFKMANSYGHQINNCSDVLPYAMLDFELRDSDIYSCFIVLISMVIISRFITFSAIYYKVRSFS